ncbi:MAG: DUF1043 family protein [Xanthomonadales bacterium]|nr:DUF1043 family protein [Xanthomonadales bacterium]
MSTIAWAIIGAIAGGALGAVAVWFFAVRRAGPMSVNEMKKENERFREEVNAHFVQTAELINELTDSYKRVFDHLSDGAERLVDNEALRERMPQVGRHEVRLRHIGAPRDAGATGGATVEASAAKPVKAPSDKPEASGKSKPSDTSKPSDKPDSSGKSGSEARDGSSQSSKSGKPGESSSADRPATGQGDNAASRKD